MSILIVDDDRQYLRLLQATLAVCGVTARFTWSPVEALQILTGHGVRLLVTDFHMPGLDGVDLAIRARALQPAITIVLNTGDLSPELEERAALAGINRVFEKPFCLDQLREVLDKAGHTLSMSPSRTP
jgi:CheY-like chemotaxis protein